MILIVVFPLNSMFDVTVKNYCDISSMYNIIDKVIC